MSLMHVDGAGGTRRGAALLLSDAYQTGLAASSRRAVCAGADPAAAGAEVEAAIYAAEGGPPPAEGPPAGSGPPTSAPPAPQSFTTFTTFMTFTKLADIEAPAGDKTAPGLSPLSALADVAGYWRKVGDVCAALRRVGGDFMEESLACDHAAGRLDAAAVAAAPAGGAPVLIKTPPGRERAWRARLAALFYGAILEDGRAGEPAARRLAHEIERGCYNEAIARSLRASVRPSLDSEEFVQLYSERCAAVYENLSPSGPVRAGLRRRGVDEECWALQRVLGGGLEPAELGRMSEDALSPEANIAQRMRVEQRASVEIVERTSSVFRCPKCGGCEHTWHEVQSRALDEASTIVCECKKCGRTFHG